MEHWLDESAHPLHVIRIPRNYDITDIEREFPLFEKRFVEIVRREPHTQIAIIVDISQPQGSNAANRKRIAEAMASSQKRLVGHVAAQGFVVRTPVLRAALTGVFWLTRPPWPTKVFTSRAEAEWWAREELARANADPVNRT
jgi:hypothetical protein